MTSISKYRLYSEQLKKEVERKGKLRIFQSYLFGRIGTTSIVEMATVRFGSTVCKPKSKPDFIPKTEVFFLSKS